MIITIDGPAGAGKSTLARMLADRLGFHFLDTGAMYRAVALAALRRSIDLSDADALGELAQGLAIEFEGDRVLLDGEDVSEAIRSEAVTAAVSAVAECGQVREPLVAQQRAAVGHGGWVTEGRDQGSVVFPEAACKIFLTASAEERARRRRLELEARGADISLGDVLAQQDARDRRDQPRAVGPLVAPPDAVVVPTDGMSREQVLARLTDIVRARCDA